MVAFAKYHAMGNDYLLVEPQDGVAAGPLAARVLCDRHFGVGADGVVFGPLGRPGAAGAVEVRIHNADGSACERSANGLRAFALEHARLHGTRQLVVDTGFRTSTISVDDVDAGIVSIELGRPDFSAQSVPLQGCAGEAVDVPIEVGGIRWRVTALNNGNPHAVLVLSAVDDQLVDSVGPLLSAHPRFPGRVNVEFAAVVGQDVLGVVVWERGAGRVLASGSGGCAAAAAARRLGLVGDQVEVVMSGGAFTTRFDRRGTVLMTGEVEHIATGRLAAGIASRVKEPQPS
ncbi:diaminopimelate epimerase [Lentzea albida]|uniref:Diaminopimelate epimerase n=1 Tax=Lentzea albida TaxID=65499 RepID=A0A1H9PSL6_9PSEU|nr:diaminopimelate epimerase [Lentzea albida]SER50573.1 diaminopimelate epimerase [Lentzea albida]